MNQVKLFPTRKQQKQLDNWLIASHTIFHNTVEMKKFLNMWKRLEKEDRSEMIDKFVDSHKELKDVPKDLLDSCIERGESYFLKIRGKKYKRSKIRDEVFCEIPLDLVDFEGYTATFEGIGTIRYNEYDFGDIKSIKLRRTKKKQYIIEATCD